MIYVLSARVALHELKTVRWSERSGSGGVGRGVQRASPWSQGRRPRFGYAAAGPLDRAEKRFRSSRSPCRRRLGSSFSGFATRARGEAGIIFERKRTNPPISPPTAMVALLVVEFHGLVVLLVIRLVGGLRGLFFSFAIVSFSL